MKRIAIVVLCLALLLPLSACDPSIYSFEYEELREEAVSVKLINYHRPETSRYISNMGFPPKKLLPFDFDKTRVLETLDDKKVEDFFTQASELSYTYKWYTVNSPNETCIMVTYANGDFLILSCGAIECPFSSYVGTYTSTGEVVEFICAFEGYSDFKSLVNDNFETQID